VQVPYAVSQFKTCETLLDHSRFNSLSVSLMSHTKRHAKRLLGYGRISTTAQDLLRQRQALKAYGCKLVGVPNSPGLWMSCDLAIA